VYVNSKPPIEEHIFEAVVRCVHFILPGSHLRPHGTRVAFEAPQISGHFYSRQHISSYRDFHRSRYKHNFDFADEISYYDIIQSLSSAINIELSSPNPTVSGTASKIRLLF
jgi:hypothetical protein